jgi:hypothetical protein
LVKYESRGPDHTQKKWIKNQKMVIIVECCKRLVYHKVWVGITNLGRGGEMKESSGAGDFNYDIFDKLKEPL